LQQNILQCAEAKTSVGPEQNFTKTTPVFAICFVLCLVATGGKTGYKMMS
jgi:hypothetical protein